MVQTVPDEYFPLTEINAASQRATEARNSYYSSFGLWSGAYSRLFHINVPQNKTLRDAVDSVTSLMQMGDFEGASDLACHASLHVGMVTVNGTLLAEGINMVLGVLVDPVYNLFQNLLNGCTVDNVGIANDQLSSSHENSPAEMGNLNATSDLVPLTNFFCTNISFESGRRLSAEVLMFALCVWLCILLFLVHFRFAKYFRGIDELADRHYGGAGAAGCHRSSEVSDGTFTRNPSFTRDFPSKSVPSDDDVSEVDNSESMPSLTLDM